MQNSGQTPMLDLCTPFTMLQGCIEQVNWSFDKQSFSFVKGLDLSENKTKHLFNIWDGMYLLREFLQIEAFMIKKQFTFGTYSQKNFQLLVYWNDKRPSFFQYSLNSLWMILFAHIFRKACDLRPNLFQCWYFWEGWVRW